MAQDVNLNKEEPKKDERPKVVTIAGPVDVKLPLLGLFFLFIACFIIVDFKIAVPTIKVEGELISLEDSDHSDDYLIAKVKVELENSKEKEEVEYRVSKNIASFMRDEDYVGKDVVVKVNTRANQMILVEYERLGRERYFGEEK